MVALVLHLSPSCCFTNFAEESPFRVNFTFFIKEYLLEYTQTFARTHLRPEFRRVFPVNKVRFNYRTETWESGQFELPAYSAPYPKGSAHAR